MEPVADATWIVELPTLADTVDLGRRLGQAAQPGLVVGLVGDLGAGKTHFSQAVAEGLGIPRRVVTSPTFSLVQEYHGRLWLFHFDTYRLRNTDEFLELGIDEYLGAGGVCLIEWADRVLDVLPRDRLLISLHVSGTDSRRATISAGGLISSASLQAVRQHASAPINSEHP